MKKSQLGADCIARVPDTAYSNDELFTFLGGLEETRIVLDSGSGMGIRAIFFENMGHSVVAVDLNSIVFHHENYGNIFGVVADSQNLPFRKEVFNAILCIQLLEHLDHPEKCVEDVFFVLKDQGIFLSSTPCLNIPFFRTIIIWVYRKLIGYGGETDKQFVGHKRVFSDVQLLDLFKLWFTDIKVKYSNQFTFLLVRFFGMDREELNKKCQCLPPLLSRLLAEDLLVLCKKREKYRI